MIPIEIEVYAHEDPNVLLDVLDARMSPQYLDELGANGGGSVTVNLRDPKIVADPSLLEYRNVLRVKVDGAVVGGIIIQKKSTAQIKSSADEEEVVLSGEGFRTWLNDAAVYPYKGLKKNSKTTRYFNFAAETGSWYNSSLWVTPKNLSRQGDTNIVTNPKKGMPGEWPDAPNAWWIWANSGTINNAAPGTCYFRSSFTVAAGQEGPYSLFFTVDDTYEIYLDGERLAEEPDPGIYAWRTAKRLDFDLEAGPHVIAVKANNKVGTGSGNPGGVIATLFKVGDAAVPTAAQIVMQTGDATWKVLEYPSVAPGWTPGGILLTLLDEAEARGVRFPTWLTPTFTATHDSNGQVWTYPLDWDFGVGTTYGAVVEKMEELTSTLWIDPVTLELHMVNQRGVDRSDYELGLGSEVINTHTDPSFESSNTFSTMRTNLATHSRATVNGITASTLGFAPRWYGSAGAGTTTLVTGAGDGPTGLGITTYMRKTWTTASTGVGDSGFSHSFGDANTGVSTAGFPVTAGTTYTFSVYHRATWSGAARASRIKLYWRDSAGNFLSMTTGSDISLVNGQWVRVFTTATAPASATSVGVASDPDTGPIWAIGNVLEATGLLVMSEAYLYPFFDGNTTDTVDYNYTWVGTTLASQSRQQTRAVGNAAIVSTNRLTYRHSGAGYEGSNGQRTEVIGTGAISVQTSNVSQTTGETWTIVFMARANNRNQTITPRLRGGNGSPVVLPVGVWTEVRATVVVGGSSTASTGYSIASASGHQVLDTIDVDLMTFVAGTYSGPPFSGDTPDTGVVSGGGIHDWTGTANASTSTRSGYAPIPGGRVPVIFEKGKNLLEAGVQGQGDVTNGLMIQTEEGWVAADAPLGSNSLSTYGRIEARMDADGSAALGTSLATTVFAQRALPEEGASYEIIPFDGSIPWQDFQVGDWVLAPDATGLLVKRRVVSIAVTEDDAGNPKYGVEFDTIFRDTEERINRWLARQAGGSLGAGSFANAGSGGSPAINQPFPPGPPTPVIVRTPLAPTGLAGSSTGKWSADGVTPTSEVTISWSGVTTNIDGSSTVPQYYEVYAWNTAAVNPAPTLFSTTSALTTIIGGFPVSTTWAFQVRAQNPTGEFSAFSTTTNIVMNPPATPMLTPTTPVLTSEYGLLNVAWNGLLGGATPPPQFRYLYAEVSTAATGQPWTRMGPTLTRDGRNISIPGLPLGSTRHVRLTAVDGVGLLSPVSATASAVISGVDLGNLESDVTDAIDAAEAAAAAAEATANAASSAASAALTAANTAQSTADGMVTWSTAAPLVGDGTGKPADATWFQHSGANVIGQWRWSGSAWVAEAVSNAILASDINAGKLTAGFIDVARLQAKTITAEKLIIGDFTNIAAGSDFEGTTHPWTLTGTSFVVDTVQFHSGAKSLKIIGANTGSSCTLNVDVETREGEQWFVEFWVRRDATWNGTTANSKIRFGTQTAAHIFSFPFTSAEIPTADTWTKRTGWFTVPAGTTDLQVTIVEDATAGNVWIDDIVIRRKSTGDLIVDGTITTEKIGAEAIEAGQISAGAVTAEKIEAGAIISEKISALAILAEHISADAIEANHIKAGEIQANHLSPTVGDDLDISANDSVTIISGRLDTVNDDLDGTNANLEEMQTYYKFGPSGAEISQPGSVFSLALRNDAIEMLENGNVVSYWNAGTMYVTQFVGEDVILGNHQIVKYGTGTVVRAL